MLDALEQIERDLLSAARREVGRRKVHRRASMAALAVTGTLAIATGAAAVSGVGPFTTSERGDANVYPRADAPRQILVSKDADGRAWTSLAFVGTGNAYCVQAPPAMSPSGSEMACTSPRTIQASFAEERPFAIVSSVGERTSLVAGLVPADTSAVTVVDDGSSTSLRASLSPVWTRDAEPGARLFLAAMPRVGVGGNADLAIAVDTPTGRHVHQWVPPNAVP